MVIMGNRWVSLGTSSQGSSTSPFDTDVWENVYFANNTDIGNPAATKRAERRGGIYFEITTEAQTATTSPLRLQRQTFWLLYFCHKHSQENPQTRANEV